MDDGDLTLRNRVYARFVELGRAPRVEELAEELGREPGDVEAGLRRLHDQRALVLEPSGPVRIRMANPFSAVPTPHRTRARGRWWFANCAWDAFGILAALGEDGRVESSCPDCAEPIMVDAHERRCLDDSAVVHLLVPARRWWDDIGFT